MESISDVLYSDYIVFVRCITYNHSKYIKEALDGFAMQKTVFPFVCVVLDDCSTDGEPEVIKKWMNDECDPESIQYYELELSHVYLTTHKKNANCKFAFYLLKQNLYGDERKEQLIEPWRIHTKYEAICEGDDYWTYSNKLQEQVDFLESHDKYSATSSNALVLRSGSSQMTPFSSPITKDFHKLQEVSVQRRFHTATVVFRTSAMRSCTSYKKGDWDTFKWCCLLTQGPIHYDSKVTCVYRKQNQGVTQTTPKIEWLTLTSSWADTLQECFVPKYVQKKYIVRSVTKDIILAYFQRYKQFSKGDKKKLKSLYRHNFMVVNVFYDIIVVMKQLRRKVLGIK